MEYEELYEKYEKLLEEYKKLRTENENFKKQLGLSLSISHISNYVQISKEPDDIGSSD